MEDEKIIDLFFKRSELAIEEIKNKYLNYCSSISYNILDNKEDVEECLADLYFSLWEAIPPNKPKNLKAYIGKITRNISINKFKCKRTQKHNNGEINIALSELEEIVSNNREIDESLNEEVLINHINNFLKEQTKTNRVIFVKRYFYLKSVKEIAKENLSSEESVKSSLFRTRNKLKIYLKKEGINI